MRRVARITKFFVKFCIGSLLLLGIAWAILFLVLAPELPDADEWLQATSRAEIVILARDGSALSSTGGDTRMITVAELPTQSWMSSVMLGCRSPLFAIAAMVGSSADIEGGRTEPRNSL